MASGFFAILDDIATLMDDVAAATKIATRKTAGILGDDLAVNAEKATGFLSSRELPVLWEITKGSLLNKLIVVPIALALNTFFPASIKFILIAGAFYLAYEGVEKIVSYFFHSHKITKIVSSGEAQHDNTKEKAKIKAAIITDLILSAEIVIIAIGSVKNENLITQVITVSIVAVIATIGVYGIVGLIVRMDDAGHKLIKNSNGRGVLAKLGALLVGGLPIVIKLLTIAGTVALILVSGGIFAHNINVLHHLLPTLPSIIKELILGLVAGLIVTAVITLGKKLFSAVNNAKS